MFAGNFHKEKSEPGESKKSVQTEGGPVLPRPRVRRTAVVRVERRTLYPPAPRNAVGDSTDGAAERAGRRPSDSSKLHDACSSNSARRYTSAALFEAATGPSKASKQIRGRGGPIGPLFLFIHGATMTPPSIGDSASCSSLTQTTFWPFTHTHTAIPYT